VMEEEKFSSLDLPCSPEALEALHFHSQHAFDQ
jgi:hypothetical protein